MSCTVLDDIPVAIIFRGGVGARERLAALATTTWHDTGSEGGRDIDVEIVRGMLDGLASCLPGKADPRNRSGDKWCVIAWATGAILA